MISFHINEKKEFKLTCNKCGKEIDKLDLFTGGICLECYKIEYDKLPEAEKTPDFGAKLLNI